MAVVSTPHTTSDTVQGGARPGTQLCSKHHSSRHWQSHIEHVTFAQHTAILMCQSSHPLGTNHWLPHTLSAVGTHQDACVHFIQATDANMNW